MQLSTSFGSDICNIMKSELSAASGNIHAVSLTCAKPWRRSARMEAHYKEASYFTICCVRTGLAPPYAWLHPQLNVCHGKTPTVSPPPPSLSTSSDHRKEWFGVGKPPADAQWLELTRRDPEAGTVERMGTENRNKFFLLVSDFG